MAAIPGSVPITGFVAPTDSTDLFASHDEQYGRGGYRSVADITARDAITTDRRSLGMLVHCLDTGAVYQLVGGLTNAFWVEFTASGGGGTPVNIILKNAGETISALQVVKLENDIAYVASSTVAGDNAKIVGIAATGGNLGQSISIRMMGEMADDVWAWSAGAIFLGENGALTQSPPASGFVLKLGRAISPTKIVIDLQQAVIRI